MKTHVRSFLAIIACVLFWPSFSHCAQVASLDAFRLQGLSDVVVVAQVTSVVDGPSNTYTDVNNTPYTAYPETILASVSRLIKGSLTSATVQVTRLVPSSPSGTQELKVGQTAIFFLLTLTGTAWAPADEDQFTLPALPSAPGNSLSSDPLTAELLAVATSQRASAADRAVAVHSLRQANGNDTAAALKSLLSSTEPLVYWSAATVLMLHADSDALASMQSRLSQMFSVADLPYTQGLSAEISTESSNPASLPILAALVGSTNLEVRRGASSGIAAAGGTIATSVLPPLLSDEDELLRYYAVLGLGRTTNQPQETPSYSEFQANGSAYVAYWQSQFPVSCASAVTSQFTLAKSGFRFNHATQKFVQTIAISGSPTSHGPYFLVLDGLTSGSSLANSEGVTSCAVPAGSPFLTISTLQTWLPGTSVAVTLQFSNPAMAGITFSPRILGGNSAK